MTAVSAYNYTARNRSTYFDGCLRLSLDRKLTEFFNDRKLF